MTPLHPPSAAARVDTLVRRLRASGLRLTPQRLAVLRALAHTADHPSAEQVYQRLLPSYPMLSVATVYKTIETLKAMGEILELEFRDGANRYDINIPNPHPHLVCTRCGTLQDCHVDELEGLAEQVTAATGFQILRYRLDLYGLCPACRTAEQSRTTTTTTSLGDPA